MRHRTIAVMLGLVAFAAIAGIATGAQAADKPVAAACAQFECDGGWLCVENPGGGTFCKRWDNSNLCETKVCEPE